MKRIMKTCGSIVLAASLMLGVFGVIPASAAETEIPYDYFKVKYEEAKKATDSAASFTPIKMEDATKIALSFSGLTIGEIPIESTIIRDNSSKVAKSETTIDLTSLGSILGQLFGGSGTDIKPGKTTISAYSDFKNGRNYSYDESTKSYLMDPKFNTSADANLLDRINLDAFNASGSLKITAGEDTKVGEKDCQVANLKITATGEQLAPIAKDFSKVFASLFSTSSLSSTVSSIDVKKYVKSFDLTVSLYTGKDVPVLYRTDVTGSLSLDISSKLDGFTDVSVTIKSTNTNSPTTESVTVPSEWISKARLVAGIAATKNGAKFTTAYSGKNTVFKVTGVTKTSAKKLTIPASIKSYGKNYKVTTAAKNAFKKAKKLKTLVVKNGTLKKLLKKSPTKYGLKKSVKIK